MDTTDRPAHLFDLWNPEPWTYQNGHHKTNQFIHHHNTTTTKKKKKTAFVATLQMRKGMTIFHVLATTDTVQMYPPCKYEKCLSLDCHFSPRSGDALVAPSQANANDLRGRKGLHCFVYRGGKPKGTRREVSMPLDYRYPLYPRGHVTELVRGSYRIPSYEHVRKRRKRR